MMKPFTRGERRSLTSVGGNVTTEGNAEAAGLLSHALSVESATDAEERARRNVHGFHSYPARMHPDTAERLVLGLSEKGERVLDPFCGSGTVLVEARRLGRRALGVDANPLAVRLSEFKTRALHADHARVLLTRASEIAEVANTRRKAKAGASRRYPPSDMRLFSPHVLLELDSIRTGIEQVTDEQLRHALELVLSSILTKLSGRKGDTSPVQAEKRIAAGFASRLFVRKTEEVTQRWLELEKAYEGVPEATVLLGDARELRGIKSSSIDAIITSPPYPGVYNYVEHHETRLRWLGLPKGAFDRAEIGARRKLDPLGPRDGLAAWQKELSEFLGAFQRVLRRGGHAALLIADSVVVDTPVYAVDMVKRATAGSSLLLTAVASQERPHFHSPTSRAFAQRPRSEHAILLTRT